MPVTAVLCTAISSVISSLVTALVMCFCFMKKKEIKSSEDDKCNPPTADPMYDTPQVLGESSTNIKLKQNTSYALKDTPLVFGKSSADIELKQTPVMR